MSDTKEHLEKINSSFLNMSLNFREALTMCQNNEVFDNSIACTELVKMAFPLSHNLSTLTLFSKFDIDLFESRKKKI